MNRRAKTKPAHEEDARVVTADDDDVIEFGDGKIKVKPGTCPQVASHEKTRVYKTSDVKKRDGKWYQRRWCVCDDCGSTWKIDGPPANPDALL